MTNPYPVTAEPAAAPSHGGAVRAVVIGLIGAASLFLLWTASGVLLMIFAALLIAVVFDAVTVALCRVLPIGRSWNLVVVAVTATLLVAGLLFWSGMSIAGQINELVRALNDQLAAIAQKMTELGVTQDNGNTGAGGNEALRNFGRMMFPDPGRFFGEARNAFTLTVGGIAEVFVVMLIGLFVAADPPAYRRSVVELFPRYRRAEVSLFLDESGYYLRRWLVGQLAEMMLLGVLTVLALSALGVPNALLLGIQAGLLTFVPYLGAIVGGVPIMLIALPLGSTTTLMALGIYVLIHMVVGYGVAPIVQKHLVRLPPAWTLASLMLFGALFGVASVAVATPMVATIRHAVRRLQGMTPATTPAQKVLAPSEP